MQLYTLQLTHYAIMVKFATTIALYTPTLRIYAIWSGDMDVGWGESGSGETAETAGASSQTLKERQQEAIAQQVIEENGL